MNIPETPMQTTTSRRGFGLLSVAALSTAAVAPSFLSAGPAFASETPTPTPSPTPAPTPTPEPIDLPAPTEGVLRPRFENYRYPYPVKFHKFTAENTKLEMAYMDVKPTGRANGQTVVLLHGGLGFAGTFGPTIARLRREGYRVIAPDQIGFGKSSRDLVRYSFGFWAENTNAILTSLGIKRANIVGHSMGGVLAARYALTYPDQVRSLAMVNPMGLEDYRLLIPFKSVEYQRAGYAESTWESIQALHRGTFSEWGEEFATTAYADYRQTLNPDYDTTLAVSRSYIQHVIYNEPIFYELGDITSRTLLTWGDLDATAPGKGYATEENQAKLGNFARLTRVAGRKIPNVRVHKFAGVNHVPYVERPEEFQQVLLNFLRNR